MIAAWWGVAACVTALTLITVMLVCSVMLSSRLDDDDRPGRWVG